MKYKAQKFNLFYKKRKKIHIIRPFLVFNRLHILKICIFLRLPLFVDVTNKFTNFRRNRLRHQVFPLFKIFFNPKIDLALARFIAINNLETTYFNNHLTSIKKFIQIKNFNNKKKIQALKWVIFLPKALQRKFYQRLLASSIKSLTFNEIEFLLQLKIDIFK